MKSKLLITAIFFAGFCSASAFSLDFMGLELDGSTTLSGADGDQLTIQVPEFGNVAFGVQQKGVSAVVDDNFGTAAIEFDSSQIITVNFFAGLDVENVMVGFVGVANGADAPFYTSVDSQSGFIQIDSGSAGISSLTFDVAGPKVPEPSTALLGLIGVTALLRRRR